MKFKVVIMIDKDGKYIVHGASEQTPVEMFKTMQPLWHFDPSTERVHYAEIDAYIPGTEHLQEYQDYYAPEIDAG